MRKKGSAEDKLDDSEPQSAKLRPMRVEMYCKGIPYRYMRFRAKYEMTDWYECNTLQRAAGSRDVGPQQHWK